MVGCPHNPMGFPTKNDHFGVFFGVPPFQETPIKIESNAFGRAISEGERSTTTYWTIQQPSSFRAMFCFGSERSHEKNPGLLGCIGDYTTQLYGDYSKPW